MRSTFVAIALVVAVISAVPAESEPAKPAYSHPFVAIDGSAIRVARPRGWGEDGALKRHRTAEPKFGQATSKASDVARAAGVLDIVFGPGLTDKFAELPPNVQQSIASQFAAEQRNAVTRKRVQLEDLAKSRAAGTTAQSIYTGTSTISGVQRMDPAVAKIESDYQSEQQQMLERLMKSVSDNYLQHTGGPEAQYTPQQSRQIEQALNGLKKFVESAEPAVEDELNGILSQFEDSTNSTLNALLAVRSAMEKTTDAMRSLAPTGLPDQFFSPQLATIYTAPHHQGQLGPSSAGAEGYMAVPWLSQFGTGVSSAGSSWSATNIYIDYRSPTLMMEYVTELRSQGRFAEAEMLLRSTAPIHLGGPVQTLDNQPPQFYANLIVQWVGGDYSRLAAFTRDGVKDAIESLGVNFDSVLQQLGINPFLFNLYGKEYIDQLRPPPPKIAPTLPPGVIII